MSAGHYRAELQLREQLEALSVPVAVEPQVAGRYPDLLAVRPDGTRVAIELQGSRISIADLESRTADLERDGCQVHWVLVWPGLHRAWCWLGSDVCGVPDWRPEEWQEWIEERAGGLWCIDPETAEVFLLRSVSWVEVRRWRDKRSGQMRSRRVTQYAAISPRRPVSIWQLVAGAVVLPRRES
jgi:hypothetical protein